jgi:predicted DNA-binding protein YlxM (UPF0122 family)
MGILIDIDKKRSILEFRAKGYSFAKIAREADVAKQTAIDVCKENEEVVATLKALDLEELYESHAITSKERITAHANLLSRIREEIETRNLTDIPTDKLIDLYLKTFSALKEEVITPNFQTSKEQERDKREREYLNRLSAIR